MTQSGFSHRPFNIPEQIVSRALKLIAQDKSLTPLMHEYTGRMGDYDLAKT